MRFAVPTIALLLPSLAAGQGRIVERHEWNDPEGRIMAYYSAALAFTSISAPGNGRRGFEAGLELSYLPPLSREQRSAGFSKTESTNLLPIVPRPRIAMTLPWNTRFEASYVPPLPVFGVKASLLSVAVSHPVIERQSMRLSARLAGSSALVKGPITCNKAIEDEGPGERLFYAKVCHGHESEDEFHAPALSAELLASRIGTGAITPYAGLGVRKENTRFVVGVKTFSGDPDPNHPVLEMSLTRPYGMLGATWARSARTAISGEIFYAPGSLATVRLLGTMLFGGLQ